MPCDYSRYPADWREIRARILARAGDRCEECGVENHTFGYRDRTGVWNPLLGTGEAEHDDGERVIQIVLTVAHLDHDLSHNTDDNLRAWCQRCHLRHDVELHSRHAAESRRRRLTERGQTALPLEG